MKKTHATCLAVLAILSVCICGGALWAEEAPVGGKVTGKVVDGDGKAVKDVGVSVLTTQGNAVKIVASGKTAAVQAKQSILQKPADGGPRDILNTIKEKGYQECVSCFKK